MSTTEPNSPIARAKASPAPVRMAGASAGSTIRRKIVQLPAPSDAAACSASRSTSISTGCTERTTNGSVTKTSAMTSAGLGGDEVHADRAVRPVERQQHDAGDDRRQREGQVDEGVDDALARELVAHEHPGDQRAEHGVDEGDDRRDAEREEQRRARGRRGDRVPEAADAVVERLGQHGGQRQQHDHAEPQHGDAEPERADAADAGAATGRRAAGAGAGRVAAASAGRRRGQSAQLVASS